MSKKPNDLNLLSLDEKLHGACKDLGLIDPMVLLVGLANGKDLSKESLVYEMALNIQESIEIGEIDEFEILEFLEEVFKHCRWKPVEQTVQKDAQKAVVEYMHNKKKAVEITDKSTNKHGAPTDLTKREIRRFNRTFNNDY